MTCNKTDSNSISLVTDFLNNGKVIILPTDTVYGFSGIVDLKNKTSFKTDDKIRRIKGRSETKPLIQLIANPSDIFKYTTDKIPEELLNKWPGPLTIIVNVKKESELADEPKTVAFRCPGDEWLRNIIQNCNCPVFSTSVNRSGNPVLETEDEIIKEFEKEADLIVLDGDKKGSLPSTLVSIENDSVKILRQGAVQL